MSREDVRDETLGSLLRKAAETAAGAAEAVRSVETPGLGAAHLEGAVASPRTARIGSGRFRARIAGAAALAAGLVAALTFPALARRRADRVLLGHAAEHLSRSLIRESSSFLAELPAASELEAAASDWAGSLFRTDIDL